VLVHRVAYLIRVKREDPRGILVLSYNRHAAVEIRKRLKDLIGEDADSVTVSTCHALAMRLVGASFVGQAQGNTPHDFDKIVLEAVTLLRADGFSKVEAEALRETLIQGYRWILVDEYQDIGPEEYALIAAVAGRSLDDPDMRLSLFAVGDDDQNIYAFAGASIEFIRRFEADYSAKPSYLIENYRSTASIIDAANRVISAASGRMKVGHAVVIDRDRTKAPFGGALTSQDPVSHGRVQILHTVSHPTAQATAAVDELIRLSLLLPDWSWRKAAIIAREWQYLEPVRSYCEAKGIPVQVASESVPPFWRLREVKAFLAFLNAQPTRMLTAQAMHAYVSAQSANRWWSLISDAIEALEIDLAGKAAPIADVIEMLAEWLRDARQEQQGLLLLTAHRAKGLEFDHVIILDGGWERPSKGEDRDAPRILFYVAMTRAKRSLAIVSMKDNHPIIQPGVETWLDRRVGPPDFSQTATGMRYQTVEPRMVDLSWIGRQAQDHPVVAAVAAMKVGDPVSLMESAGRWRIRDRHGVEIGQMARSYKPPSGSRFVRGEVSAIIEWRKEDSAEEFQRHIRRDVWEVVLPELVFDRSLAERPISTGQS
jgi:ATP-dependent DNA helicase RecQ